MKITSARDLAAAVRGRRIALALSQAELAKKAGVSRPWLSKVEAGKPTAEFGLIVRLLEALGLTLQLTDGGKDTTTVDLDSLLDDYENR